jgi:hypothetical protein
MTKKTKDIYTKSVNEVVPSANFFLFFPWAPLHIDIMSKAHDFVAKYAQEFSQVVLDHCFFFPSPLLP